MGTADKPVFDLVVGVESVEALVGDLALSDEVLVKELGIACSLFRIVLKRLLESGAPPVGNVGEVRRIALVAERQQFQPDASERPDVRRLGCMARVSPHLGGS